jgi:hypothetical protein
MEERSREVVSWMRVVRWLRGRRGGKKLECDRRKDLIGGTE